MKTTPHEVLAARGKTPRRAGTGRQWRRNASNQPFIDDFSRYSTHARDQYSTSRVPRDFCHGLLGIQKDADKAQIKARYRELAKRYHPDANQSDPTSEWMFKEIQNAYSTLTARRPENQTPVPYAAQAPSVNQSGWKAAESYYARKAAEETIKNAEFQQFEHNSRKVFWVGVTMLTLEAVQVIGKIVGVNFPGRWMATVIGLAVAMTVVVSMIRQLVNSRKGWRP